MKTSTKLLLFVALLLIAVPIIHAHHLNNKIERNDYTLYSKKEKKPGEMVAIASFDHIHIASLNNVAVEINQGDSTSLEKEHDLDINISQRGDTLYLEQALSSRDYNSDMKTITIRTPNLKSADIAGAIWSDTSGTGASREIQTVALPSKVSIAGFSGVQFWYNVRTVEK